VYQDPAEWEVALENDIINDYGWDPPGYPRDGQCAMMVHTRGEEHFDDFNANGVFDPGEYNAAYDTFEDPFIDYNGDFLHEDGLGNDPFELYIDDDGQGDWDGKDGLWNDNKYIFRNYQFLITGQPYIRFHTPDGTAIGDGGQINVNVLVCDRNMNQLMPGTHVCISHLQGGIRGETERIWPDSNALGPDEDTHRSLIEFNIQLYDINPGVVTAENGELNVSVVWPGCTDGGGLELIGTLYYTVE
jgi:hypothetical protein